MTYSLAFNESAQKEWDSLDGSIKKLFKTKLAERLENPHIESAKLRGMEGCYKIKLRKVGYRLVYQVFDNDLIISVVGVGKRDKSEVYAKSKARL